MLTVPPREGALLRGLRRQVPWGLTCCLVFSSPGVCHQLESANIGHPPEWAKQAVWYQVFPERFRNGDTENDPTVADIQGSWPHEQPAVWHISPWTSDWYKLQPWEEGDSKGFYFHAQLRRYGGDLQGVLNELDYLQNLGITAIYFNPLFQSPSLHKYDASSYHHIDRNFGPDPNGDKRLVATENPVDPATWKWTAADRLFLDLIREAHRRGIRVVIDGVFHCTGSTFWAFQDLQQRQQQSPFRDWYQVIRWDDPATPVNEFDYEGWFGVRELPELKEADSSLAAGPRAYIRSVVTRWMDPDGDGNPSDGIDGWRLDAAEMVPPHFWLEFRGWVKGINPDAYLVAELWWEDWKNDKMFNAAPWLQGDKFDAVMNYRWAREVIRFFVGDTTGITPSEFDARLRSLRNDYPEGVNFVLMNLLDSHDTDRIGSMIVNVDTRYDHNVGLNDNRTYQVRKPNDAERGTQELIALFQMTYLGAPMIFYGDEAGMWGADDPDDRKPMLWRDLTYEDESHHPFGLPRPVDKNEFNDGLFRWYRKLIDIRKAHPALWLGDVTTLMADDRDTVFVFARRYKGERIVIAVNNSRGEKSIDLPSMGTSRWRDLIADRSMAPVNGVLRLALASRSGVILEEAAE